VHKLVLQIGRSQTRIIDGIGVEVRRVKKISVVLFDLGDRVVENRQLVLFFVEAGRW
jgi:hypothetical protein